MAAPLWTSSRSDTSTGYRYRRESRGIKFHPKISRFLKIKSLEGKLESHRFKWSGPFILHTLTYDLKWLSNPSSWHWATTWIMTLHTTEMNKAMNSNVKMKTFHYYTVVAEQWWCYWHHRKQGNKELDGVPTHGIKRNFLNLMVNTY